jgi:YidC/Oxa1 family membrane protein insertase
MFNALFESVAFALDFFYRLYPSYGVAIGLLTAAAYTLSFPLAAASARSMAAFSKLAPELREIQHKHRADPMRGNQESRALMRAKGPSIAGCLSGVLQIPLFLVLYKVLRGLTATTPRYLGEGSALRAALARDGGHMPSFGMDLARSASHALAMGFGAALPYLLLVAALIGAAYASHRYLVRRAAQAPAPAGGPQEPAAALMRRVAALTPLTYLFTISLPAGVVVYLFCSALSRLVQQALIYRFVVR